MTTLTRGRARLGVLVPYTNTNLEPDLGLLSPPGCSLHIARLGGYDADMIPDSGQMATLGRSALDEPLTLLAGARPDVVLYGCTSATLALGADFDRRLVEQVQAVAAVPAITAAGALLEALDALGIRRIAFASPYVAELNDRAIGFLAERGVETVSRAQPEHPLGNHDQGALTPGEVIDLGHRANSDAAEALVLSCTDMRAVESIETLEQALGKPVVSSNQALMFAALRALGVETAGVRCGQLFQIRSNL